MRGILFDLYWWWDDFKTRYKQSHCNHVFIGREMNTRVNGKIRWACGDIPIGSQ